MISLPSVRSWLRRQIAWSNSRRSWYERFGVVGLVFAAACGWWLSRDWPGPFRLLLLVCWLAFLSVVVQRGVVRLVGPVFFFELLRGSRKRIHLIRALYAFLMFAVIAYIYFIRAEIWENRSGSDPHAQSDTAFAFFLAFFGIQMIVVAILTPVMIAGAIAEDKERRVLEFILATDLRSREIVLGKLAGRMATMTMFLLAGLPILSLLQLLGGIDPDLLIVSMIVTVLTFASVAAISMWYSVMLRRSRDAIVMTFLTIIGYVVLSGVARGFSFSPHAAQSVHLFGATVSIADGLELFGAGNPLAQLFVLIVQTGGRSGGSMYDLIPDMLREYAIFHILILVVCVVWSVLRLRPVALVQDVADTPNRAGRGRFVPAIGRFPMLWKELFLEGGLRLNWLMRLPIYLIVFLSFVPPVWITYDYWNRLVEFPQLSSVGKPANPYSWHSDSWEEYGEAINIWVRMSSGLVGSLLLLAVAARAAGSISGERSRQTLDELLTSPLTNSEIINAKWCGSFFGLRRGWLWLGAIYFVALLAGGTNFLGVVLSIFVWFIYAGFMASVGVWFSSGSKSPFWSSMGAILTALFVLFGQWIFSGLFCFLPLDQAIGYSSHDLTEWLAAAQLGVTPSVVLGYAPLHNLKELENIRDRDIKIPVFMFFGAIGFLISAFAIKRMAAVRFAAFTGRTTIRRPERKMPIAMVAKPQTSE